MILSFFKKDPALDAASALYASAVEQARSPVLYAEFGVPDTVEGRFEMVALHVYLLLRRLKAGDSDAKKVGQKLFDVMFQNMDDSLRELGVGDMSIGRKIRKMAENFYGRIGAYENALKSDPKSTALALALSRNIFQSDKPELALSLARYVRLVTDDIEKQPMSRIAGGIVRFPETKESQ